MDTQQSNSPRVLNKHYEDTRGAVYIGRPSFWGNPFKVGIDGDQGECVEAYRRWIHLDHQAYRREAAKRLLKGRDLACYCKPRPCHGDVLLEIANGS